MTEDRVENLLSCCRSKGFARDRHTQRRWNQRLQLTLTHARGSQDWWHDIHDSQSWMQQQNLSTQQCKVSSSHRFGSQYHVACSK
ncbi:hypothetical protein ABBQ32_010812 [Trebouxia sp. C0010 RCD-2024]